jgi:multiple antibiotic resistance protein
MLDPLLKFAIAFFVVVEPVSLAPAFAALTEGADAAFRRHMATKAVIVAAVICVLFALGGAALLETMGISLEAFKIGGGVLLLLISIDMVFARPSGPRHTTPQEDTEARRRQDISVFPLAFPLITGPGALAAILLEFSDPALSVVARAALLGVIALVLLIALVFMLLAGPLMKLIGVTGSNVVSRLTGVILAALAVQYMIDGARAAFA